MTSPRKHVFRICILIDFGGVPTAAATSLSFWDDLTLVAVRQAILRGQMGRASLSKYVAVPNVWAEHRPDLLVRGTWWHVITPTCKVPPIGVDYNEGFKNCLQYYGNEGVWQS